MKLKPNNLAASRAYKTPFLLTDLKQVTRNYRRLQKALPKTKIHYSIKSNNDPILISHLHSIGSSFDVATWHEISMANRIGIPSSKLVYSSPIKKELDIKKANRIGVNIFAYDSIEELEKIRRVTSGAKVILRILVESEGSQCPMFKKFGVYIDEASGYLHKAVELGLKPIGLTFHVGSQCLVKDNWLNALFRANKVWNDAHEAGIQLEMLNLGGGLPVAYDQAIEPIEIYTRLISKEIKNNFKGLRYTYIEPGRYMTDQASIMVASVIGKAHRNGTNWLYLDVGGFNGLFEIFEGFNYQIVPELKGRKKVYYAVGGPTCDGLDVIRKNILMPEVEVGDRVHIMNAGAYSTSIKKYNGFAWAKNYYLENLNDRSL